MSSFAFQALHFANGTVSSTRTPPAVTMTSSFPCGLSMLLVLVLLLSAFSSAQTNCNTQANPYCAGDLRFANIICPCPNVCYFSDRLGTPSCCGAGQICLSAQNVPPPGIATVAPNSAVSLVSTLGQVTASMSMFTTNALSLSTPAAAFSTVGGLLVGAARPIVRAKETTPVLLPFLLMAWHIF